MRYEYFILPNFIKFWMGLPFRGAHIRPLWANVGCISPRFPLLRYIDLGDWI
jgi:hypothetical protein